MVLMTMVMLMVMVPMKSMEQTALMVRMMRRLRPDRYSCPVSSSTVMGSNYEKQCNHYKRNIAPSEST